MLSSLLPSQCWANNNPADLQIQCNPYQATNDIFHRTRTNNLTICMEIQKTSYSNTVFVSHFSSEKPHAKSQVTPLRMVISELNISARSNITVQSCGFRMSWRSHVRAEGRCGRAQPWPRPGLPMLTFRKSATEKGLSSLMEGCRPLL